MSSDSSELIALGMSHKTAPVEVRERFAFDEAAIRSELAYLRRTDVVREAMLLSTCNRVELYAVPQPGGLQAVRDAFARHGASAGPLDSYLYQHAGKEAVLHLFRVACSLDSLVVGEPQILGQVKTAVRIAEETQSLGAVLNRLTQRSLWVAKHVRTHTEIGRSTVGIGNAGVLLAQQLFSNLADHRAMLIGVGEMGRQVVKAMLHTGLRELLVANRTFERSVEVAEPFGATPVRYERMREYLDRVDIVITATGSPDPILGVRDIRAAMKARRWRPLFLVDLAVPRNIHPDVGDIEQAFLFNVDDLEHAMEEGRKARDAASVEALTFVESEADRFAERLATLHINDGMGRIVRHAEELRQRELNRSDKWLARLGEDDRAAVDKMTRALVKRVLHRPLRAIRQAAQAGDAERVLALLESFERGERPGHDDFTAEELLPMVTEEFTPE